MYFEGILGSGDYVLSVITQFVIRTIALPLINNQDKQG